MGQRARFQPKTLLAAAYPRMPFVCVSMLVVLALISLMTGPLLDLDGSSRRHGPPPLPITQRTTSVEPLKSAHRSVVLAGVGTSSETIWASKLAEHYYGCSSPSKSYRRHVSESEATGYLLIEASGGLNQQRTGITDAVVVARILNATLVVPHLDHKSFWKDSSNFSDIFDVDRFISTLELDVQIIKELPEKLKLPRGRPYSTRVPRKCTQDYYRNRVLPVLRKKKAMRIRKFDFRLANKLEEDLQKLRCRVNYHALHFTRAIQTMGETLVKRLRQRSGRYIALHLRFEPDMLAFSGCYYGGGEREIKELGLIRKRWKTLHQKNPAKQRRNGKCPLTPEEVGIMLQALGFRGDSHIYVASGEVYGGENSLAGLKALFPNFHTKDTLATKEELQPFSAYSSRMAAIDFIVCDESDVFIANNNGNMARILTGRRRYFGHKRTIRPNAKRLGSLFLAKPNMTRAVFSSKLRKVQKGFMGEPNEVRPGRGQFFGNPSACICENPKSKEKLMELQQQARKKVNEDEKDDERHANSDNGLEDEDDTDQEEADADMEENEQDDERYANSVREREDEDDTDQEYIDAKLED